MKTHCPNEELIADFIEGNLTEKVRNSLENHLAGCNRCLDEVSIGSGLVRSADQYDLKPVPERVTLGALNTISQQSGDLLATVKGKLKRSVRHLCSSLVYYMPGLPNSLAPVRGSKRSFPDMVQLRKTFREFETEIDLEKIDADNVRIRVHVFCDKEKRKDMRISLERYGRECASMLANGGSVVFDDMAYGTYSLQFSRNGQVVGSYTFTVQDTGKRQ